MIELLGFIDRYIIELIIWIIIASAIMSWLIAFNVINIHNPMVRTIWDMFNALTEPMLRPIRNMLPNMGGVDISPLILILILLFIRTVIIPNIARMLIGA